MNRLNKLIKREQLHKLIISGFTGSADDYANRLNISRSCFFNYMEDLTDAGAVIEYSRVANKYHYLNEFEFEIKIKASNISEEQMDKIKGGQINFVQSFFLDWKTFSLPLKNICSFLR